MNSFKGYVILLPLLFSFVTTSKAQEAFVPETTIGVKGGANLSQYSFNPSVSQRVTYGYTGGLVFRHIPLPKLGVQIELNFVQRGWEERVASEQYFTRKLNHIELPFMTHVALGARNTNYILNFGPTASYLLSGKKGVEAPDEETFGYYYKDIDYPFMLGLSLGVGLVQKTPVGVFQLEGRAFQSLSNVFRHDPDLLSSKNLSIGLTMSYQIMLQGKNRNRESQSGTFNTADKEIDLRKK